MGCVEFDHRDLQDRHKPPVDLSAMNRAFFEALDPTARVELLCRLHTMTVELSERLARNSANSSRPPSSDSPFGGAPTAAGSGGSDLPCPQVNPTRGAGASAFTPAESKMPHSLHKGDVNGYDRYCRPARRHGRFCRSESAANARRGKGGDRRRQTTPHLPRGKNLARFKPVVGAFDLARRCRLSRAMALAAA